MDERPQERPDKWYTDALARKRTREALAYAVLGALALSAWIAVVFALVHFAIKFW